MNTDPYAGGSNNSPRQTALQDIITYMEINVNSVFLDVGAGYGIPCIAVALRTGCRCIGIEFDNTLVETSRQFANEAGVGDLCEFMCMDVIDVDLEWLQERNISVIYWFDRVFLPQTWNRFNDVVEQYASLSPTPLLTVASCFKVPLWDTNKFITVRKIRFQMCLGTSSHTMYIMRIIELLSD